MSRITYTLDPLESEKCQALVLTKASGERITIPYPQNRKFLEEIAARGTLLFNSKELVINLYGKTEFFYTVDDKGVSPMLRSGDVEFPLNACDFICGGSSPWYVKGIALKWITTPISWKDLKQAYAGVYKSVAALEADLQEDEEAPKIRYEDGYRIQTEENPLPVLILKERTGAFANLYMDYGNVRLPFGELVQVPPHLHRQEDVEKGWEKDLLETGYLRKKVDSTHYYCPLDKVASSLAFLLELGWKILDSQGSQVVLFKEAKLAVESQQGKIVARGKLLFSEFEADLSKVAGAFNRRTSFVQLVDGSTGLLPPNWHEKGLAELFEEGEVVGETIQVKGPCLGALSELFDSKHAIRLDESLKALRERLSSFQGVQTVKPSALFVGDLRTYQLEGLSWLKFLYDFHFSGLLADEMGLGKTIQTIAFFSLLEPSRTILIVAPTSLIFNWKQEIQTFLPGANLIIHHGTERKKQFNFSKGVIVLTSYTTLRLDLPLFATHSFDCLILDEAQTIKNPRTQIFQSLMQLHSKFRLALTGTPVENHPDELWAHFHFLMPELLGSEESFLSDLQAGASDPRYLKRIKKKIAPFILRRKKEEVAKDLPEKIEQTVWVEMTACQRKIYEDFLAGLRQGLVKKVRLEGIKNARMEILEAILRLRQICCHPLLATQTAVDASSGKFEALLSDLETTFEEGRKALIYSQFTQMLGLLRNHLKDKGYETLYLDGSTQNREKIVQQFQESSSIRFFLISLKAGGTGLNLTAADYVFLYDPWWNEAVENQAIDRAHRIGRKDVVIAKRFVTLESIEEKMMKLKRAKRELTTDLLEETAILERLTSEELFSLIA